MEDEDVEYFDIDICPEECSLEKYDRIVDEREKRLDIEEVIYGEKKLQSLITKDLEYLVKRSKTLEGLAAAADNELIAFQVTTIAQIMPIVVTRDQTSRCTFSTVEVLNSLQWQLSFVNN